MPNRLAHQSSPYLQQHAGNPVDWYPWGEEALARAKDEDRPILLSIGYSACHWCHVMERESFEDEETAALMNQGFVNIKVDREERPDLDSIYMRALQASMGRGGWPLTAFLTPEGKFFYGGTYFPPEPRHGMPSFRQVLSAVLDAYRNRRQEVEEGSDRLLAALRETGPRRGAGAHGSTGGGGGVEGGLSPEGRLASVGSRTLEQASLSLAAGFDSDHGGFGPAPKFPQPDTLEFLLGHARRVGDEALLEMVLITLRAMARGGIRDHLGGGFHRYSVDRRWLVPHFEKMLYDNGLLARAYLHAWQITGDTEMEEAATSTLDFLLDGLRDPGGGFYSALDADSEGEEGLFYLWRPEEVDEVLGEEGPLFREIYDVTGKGNFEGRNILHLEAGLSTRAAAMGMDPEELQDRMTRARRALEDARSRREPPFRDEKVLVAWNAFTVRALAEAGGAMARRDYVEAGEKAARFLLDEMGLDGRLLRSWKDGKAHIPAFLEDYAGLGNALLSLYESTLEPRWLLEARRLCDLALDLFWDQEAGMFFDAPRDGESLVVRPREVMDNATPSGNSLAVELLLRLGAVFEDVRYREVAVRVLTGEADTAVRIPAAFGRLLSCLALALTPPLEVVILGDRNGPEMDGFLATAQRRFLPSRVLVGGDPQDLPALPLLEGRTAAGEGPVAYVCRDFTCSAPIRTPEELDRELAGTPGSH